MSQTLFTKGDQVEVARPDRASAGFYYPATVLRPVVKDKVHIFVQYYTLYDGPKLLTEIVELGNVRPMPPEQLHQLFKVGNDVDAYRDSGWSRGVVMDILENSKYLVRLRGEEVVFQQGSLRIHREWDDGSWVPPLQEEKKSSGMVIKSRKFILKIKCSKKSLGPRFENGTVVEVSSDEEGYKGAWYSAKIIDYKGNDKFLVEYQHLVTDDETEPLREETHSSYIRPCPPPLSPVGRFKLLQNVDAWYNDGWWEGVISKVLSGSKYVVYFSSVTNEEIEFKHSNLRPHQNWINGKWICASTVTKHGHDHKEFADRRNRK